MGYTLRAGISFCEVSDRLLFLDLVADRYFCLQSATEQAFRSLLAARLANIVHLPDLDPMLRSGVLVKTPEYARPCPFRIQQQASLSLLDGTLTKVSPRRLLGALASLIGARLSLRWHRLHLILRAVELGKISWPRTGSVDMGSIQAAATAFEATSRVLRSHDKCLSRSIALARYLAARGLPADLVIGVKLRPFAAHAWVQSGRWLVNDRIDNIRSYTPIMAA